MSHLWASSATAGGLDRDDVISIAAGCRHEVLRILRRKYARFTAMDLEDCVSSALESLLAQPVSYFKGRFASDGAVKAWLIHAARNDLLNADAKWTRRVVAVDPTAPVTLIDLLGASDIAGPVFADDEANKANQYARLIPEADREIAHLAFFERLKTAEIAEALGMEALAVQRTIDRARKTVRRRLGDEITENRLCELVAPDLSVLCTTGEFTPELRQHLRSCRACELIVAEACGRAIRFVLPPAAGGGLLAWVLARTIRRGSRTAAAHAPAGSSATAAMTAATSTASASAGAVLASATAVKAGIVVVVATVAVGGGAQVVRLVTHHDRARSPVAHVVVAEPDRHLVTSGSPAVSKPQPTPRLPASTNTARHRKAAMKTVRKARVIPAITMTMRPPATTKTTATRTVAGAALSPTGPVSRVRP